MGRFEFGPDHPFKPERATKTYDLCNRYGVLNYPWMQVLNPEPLDPGDAVEVGFRLPGNAFPIECRARVAWVNAGTPYAGLPPGVAVQFVAMAQRDRDRLREYLEDYCRRHGRARRFARPWPVAEAHGEVRREDHRRGRQGT